MKISLNFLPKGPINNIPLSEPKMVRLPTNISLGLNELTHLSPKIVEGHIYDNSKSIFLIENMEFPLNIILWCSTNAKSLLV